MSFHRAQLRVTPGDDQEQLRQQVEAANAAARDHFMEEDFRSAFAAELTNSLYEGFQHENLLNLLFEVENLPWDGKSSVVTTKGLRAFKVARGGYVPESGLTSEVTDIGREIIGFHLVENVHKFRMNFSFTAQQMVNLGVQRMDATLNQQALGLLQAAIGVGNPSYMGVSGLTLANVDTAIAGVRSVTNTNATAIVGQFGMVDKIPQLLTGIPGGSGLWVPNIAEEYARTGVYGQYKGVPIVALRNFLDDKGNPFFPGNELIVTSSDAAKFAFYGAPESQEGITGPVGWDWHYQLIREWGGIVHRPDRIRRIVDSAVPA
jgi:hypothetical protein